VALVVLSIGLGGGTPDPAAPAQEVVAFYEDELIRQRLAAYVLAASMPFLLFFASSLASFRWLEIQTRVPFGGASSSAAASSRPR
jgi:hypothetical protein